MTSATMRINEQHNGIEILFASKPDSATLDTLKANGFRWHRSGGYWYNRNTAENMKTAEAITGGTATGATVPAEEYNTILSDGYMGAIESTGNQYANGKRLYGAELSKAIREAMKKCGYKGYSVSVKTYSGGQSIKVTLKATLADLVSVEEFAQTYKMGYWMVNLDGTQIHRDCLPWEDFDKCEAIRKHTAQVRYDYLKADMLGEYGADYHNASDIFTEAFTARVDGVKRILNAFNHDDSNSMVDYFDRHFYEDIIIKLA